LGIPTINIEIFFNAPFRVDHQQQQTFAKSVTLSSALNDKTLGDMIYTMVQSASEFDLTKNYTLLYSFTQAS
jgi:hypothetical protein